MSWFRRSSASSAPATPPEPAAAAATAKPTTDRAILTPPEGLTIPELPVPDDAQKAMIQELKEHTVTLLLPTTDDYYIWEKRFLDDTGTHARYCRAAKWKLDDAKARIWATMEWRRQFRPELITMDEIKDTASTGKLLLNGFDKDARPIIYMRPGRGPPPDNQKQVRYLIFLLERAIDVMPDGQERVSIVVDYKDATKQPRTPLNVSLEVLHILQRHYVERLGRGLVVHFPWIVNGFFKAISPFMDPITRDKIRFDPTLTDLISPSQLEAEYPNGEFPFQLDIDQYFADLTETCCLAKDGTRQWKGEAWVPPTGRGIVWSKEQKEKEGAGEKMAAVPAATQATSPAAVDAEAEDEDKEANGVNVATEERKAEEAIVPVDEAIEGQALAGKVATEGEAVAPTASTTA